VRPPRSARAGGARLRGGGRGAASSAPLWIERFATFEELRAAVREFATTYNEHWLLERHGYRPPAEAREHLLALAAVA
jgi:hypothetical protein